MANRPVPVLGVPNTPQVDPNGGDFYNPTPINPGGPQVPGGYGQGGGGGGGYGGGSGGAVDESASTDVLQVIEALIKSAQDRLSTWDDSKELQGQLQNIIDGNGQAFDRTTAKVDDANARMKSIAASGRAGLLGILNGQNSTAIQSQVGNQVARKAKTDEQAGARALLAQVLASGQDLDVASAQEQLNQLQESVVPGDPLAVVAPVAGAAMTAFGLWSQSQKDKKKTPNQVNQAANT